MVAAASHRHRRLSGAVWRLVLLTGASAAFTLVAMAAPASSFGFPPFNISPPTITGIAQQGQTLTEVHGSWTNSPTGYTYQWQRCNASGESCASISGATAQTYAPVAEDVGHKLRVAETASNFQGPGSPAESTATAVVVPPVPSNSALPTITGTAQQGQTLTEVHGSWTNSPTEYAYQWQRCNSSGESCAAISGASAQTYGPVAEDVGHRLRVQETASNAGGSSSPVVSSGHRRGGAPGSEQFRAADDHRYGAAGPDADRGARQLDQLTHRIRLPVAAMQLLR